jgi:hypothetical protein
MEASGFAQSGSLRAGIEVMTAERTTTDAIVMRTTISSSARSGEVEGWWRGKSDDRHVRVRGHSVETELVALDVLHHEARLVVAIGWQ